MKVSISMLSVQKQLQKGEMCTLDFLKYAARLYVKGVEVLDSFIPKDTQGLSAIKTKLEQTGFEIVSYGIDHPSKGQDLESIKEGIKVAQQLGASYIRVLGTLASSATASEVEDFVRQALDVFLPEIENTELILCVENQGNSGFSSSSLINILKQTASNQVRMSLNLANCILAGEDPQRVIEQLQGEIAYVQATDLRHVGDQEDQNSPLVGAILGLGLVPLDSLVERLHGEGYQGWISVEFTGLEDVFFGIEASLKNLHQVLYEFANKGVSASGEPWPLA